jgi:uncharacterized protein
MSNPAKSSKASPHSIVWFEIPADKPERAVKFYGDLFGWNINPMPVAMKDYWHIDTGGDDSSPDGAVMKRMHPQQQITQYVLVPSVTRYAAKIEKLGGKICVPKQAVPGMGYFAICTDTENNTFAIWEKNERAK